MPESADKEGGVDQESDHKTYEEAIESPIHDCAKFAVVNACQDYDPRGEYWDHDTRSKELDGGLDPVGRSFLGRWNGRAFACTDSEEYCLKEGFGSSVRFGLHGYVL